MDRYIQIGESIFNDYFGFYEEKSLDDTEYIPVVKIIINGIIKTMNSANHAENDIETVKNKLIEFNRNLYINIWLKHAKEDEGEDIDIEEETESAIYYFNYIYEKGEHPR